MKYMGSKARIAKHILPIILKDRMYGQFYVEPFVGGANSIDKVEGNRIGADCNEYLIAFWKALQEGWTPPRGINKELYEQVKANKEIYPKELVACIGFCFTYGAKWFRGFVGSANDVVCKGRDRIGESYRAVDKAIVGCRGITFVHSFYSDLNIPDNSIIYCDPPYNGTESYRDKFDHSKFWDWCRGMATAGHTVFVSEYNAPSDFECVWEQEVKSSLSTKDKGSKGKKAVERLFTI